MGTVSSLAARISALFGPRIRAREETEVVPSGREGPAPDIGELKTSAANNDMELVESMRISQAATVHRDV
ncbi:hypothetical protein [Rhizobium terrae]|uniref:hypothetical protein n=1 Tax=Rhizobium terrae TaxID=2171756 RepID=UPI0013C35A1B|nr:hypothetical protein [Rhizobium terrae]